MYIFFDFDSTVVTQESLDEVLRLALKNHPEKTIACQKIEEITNQGMEGQIDFKTSVLKRLEVATATRDDFEIIGHNLLNHITPGFEALFQNLKQRGHDVFVISGGFLPSLYPVTDQLQIPRSHVWANQPVFDDTGNCTGVDTTNICWTNQGKSPVIQHITKNLTPQKIVMIGDGANDMMAWQSGVADYFVGFGANIVRENTLKNAHHFAYNTDEVWAFIREFEGTR